MGSGGVGERVEVGGVAPGGLGRGSVNPWLTRLANTKKTAAILKLHNFVRYFYFTTSHLFKKYHNILKIATKNRSRLIDKRLSKLLFGELFCEKNFFSCFLSFFLFFFS